MYKEIMQDELVPVDSVLTVSGGATPAVVGDTKNFSNMTSPLSLFLKNEGDSTDLSVTYEVGFVDEADKVAGTITWVTPADGGVVTGMTNKDIHGSQCHASVSLACGKYYRFTAINNDAVNAAQVTMYANWQF